MPHARLGFKKKTVAESLPLSEARLHIPRSLLCQPPGLSVGYCITVFQSTTCTYHGSISASHRYNRINQSFSSSSAKLRGLNCYNESPSAHAQPDDKTLYSHSRPLRKTYCSLPPNAIEGRARKPRDPVASLGGVPRSGQRTHVCPSS
jgi:hypothetical protein